MTGISAARAAPDAWRALPLSGLFEIVYRDVSGAFTVRRVAAQELKVGPGKTILGGQDDRSGGYRGFRADRIEHIRDLETGEAVERNVID
jgi:predicted DNA-binding transcriptional regulator YafY